MLYDGRRVGTRQRACQSGERPGMIKTGASRHGLAPVHIEDEGCLEQFTPFQQEIKQVTMENPVVVIVVVGNIQTDDNFLEKVLRQQQRADFRVRLIEISADHAFHLEFTSRATLLSCIV